MNIYLTKTLTGLKPSYPSDHEKLGKLKLNEEYLCEVKQPRNLKFHRKFFALLQLVFNNQEKIDNFEDFRAIIIMKAGFYRQIETEKGIIWLPKSISFAKMSAENFENLYSKTLDICGKYINLESETLRQEVENFY